jgi:hypothetical protein
MKELELQSFLFLGWNLKSKSQKLHWKELNHCAWLEI